MDIKNPQIKLQDELQIPLSFFAIINESIRLIVSKRWCIIFLQICATFIFPHTSNLLFTLTYGSSYTFKPFSSSVLGPGAIRSLARFALDVFLTLFPIPLVAHTVASFYTGDEFTAAFAKIVRIVPKEWKRLLGTFLASFSVVIFVVVVGIAIPLSFGVTWVSFLRETVAVRAAAVSGLVFFGLVWFGVLTELALVIASVEEDTYGFRALVKSWNLVKGRLRLAGAVFLFGPGLGFGIFSSYWLLYGKFGMDSMVGFLSYWVTLTFFNLLQFVNWTVFYFVCKSSNHEAV